MSRVMKSLVVLASLALPLTAVAGPNPYGECLDVCDWTVPCSRWCTAGWPGDWHIYTCATHGPDCAPGLAAEQTEQERQLINWDLEATCHEATPESQPASTSQP
ncbi:hypothetical protein JGU66_04035 [Myxococcaceae bacterium JPH2]|nr:hypothetical protein [Myxococcaceae bacterium JPH2]